jgi:hypothetical protein
MPKKLPTPLRPQDAMTRFDRLLAEMAMKAETPPHAEKKKIETRRTPRRSVQLRSAADTSKKKGLTRSREQKR